MFVSHDPQIRTGAEAAKNPFILFYSLLGGGGGGWWITWVQISALNIVILKTAQYFEKLHDSSRWVFANFAGGHT